MKAQNLGKIIMTKELLAGILGIPDNVEPIIVGSNAERGLISLIVRSDEPIKDYTMPVSEGQEVPVIHIYHSDEEISDIHMRIYESVRDRLIGAVPDEDGDTEC